MWHFLEGFQAISQLRKLHQKTLDLCYHLTTLSKRYPFILPHDWESPKNSILEDECSWIHIPRVLIVIVSNLSPAAKWHKSCPFTLLALPPLLAQRALINKESAIMPGGPHLLVITSVHLPTGRHWEVTGKEGNFLSHPFRRMSAAPLWFTTWTLGSQKKKKKLLVDPTLETCELFL